MRPRPPRACCAAPTRYFKYVNARGGVNGRKIDFKFLDDAYDPSQTVRTCAS